MKLAEIIGTRVNLFFLLATVGLIALSIFSYHRIKSLVNSVDKVNHSNEVKFELERTFSYLKEAETSQRGFILTGDSSFLISHDSAVTAIIRQLSKLEYLVQDNASQSRYVDSLKYYANKRIDYLKLMMVEAARKTITNEKLNVGRRFMNLTRNYVVLIMAEEDKLLKKRTELLERNEWLSPFIISFLIFFTLLLLVLTYLRISNQLELSKELSAQLQLNNEAIAERNSFIEGVLNASVDLIVVMDKQHRVTVVNKNSADFFDKNESNIIGRKVEELRPGIETEPAFENIDKAFLGKHIHITEYKSAINDNYWDLNFIPLFKYGKVYNVMAIAHDITELVTTKNNLRDSEERYHLMVGEITDYAILFINKDGVIENWNKGAEKIKGYKAEEIIGKNFSIFYTEEDRKAGLAEQLINEARATGKANHEGWRIRKDGSSFWGSVSITPLKDMHGNLLGFSKVTRDLTQKKIADDSIARQTEILKQKNVDLENMNRELQSFAYVSSHDLQEPLRKIRTFSDRIIELDYERLSEKGKDFFGRMNEAAKRMQNLIEDLLEYARTNVTERKFEIIRLEDIIEEGKVDLKESIEAGNISIKYNGDCKLYVISFQFRQLFHNLFTNSIKFSRPDVPGKINISCTSGVGSSFNIAELEPDKTYTHISVSDNGIGFDEQYNQRIFDVFQRLHGKQEFKGTGIGLAICKKIVENHHGFIIAKGKLNEGATFDIYIPDSQT